jgi:probable F420-dependent oxidoreductase
MSIGVGIGLFDFPFSGSTAFWRWVDLCEAGGVDSIWQSDRLATREPMLECLSTMAALAGATQRIKFGMFVASAGLRDPLLLAKQCATIDVLSGGRLLPAFGVGSARSGDWEATGISPHRRGRRADEALDIIAALWRGEAVTFDSEFHHYRKATISPLPVQKNFPLWIGGSSQAAIERTARIGTGWVGGSEPPRVAAAVVAGIKSACRKYGRRIDPDHYGAGFSFWFGSRDDDAVRRELASLERSSRHRPEDSTVIGGREEILARIGEFIDAGVSKFVLRPIGSTDEQVLRQTHRLIDEVLPNVPADAAPRTR